ncbi:MAG TPA: hypothetical protein VMF61_11720 [Candidatus Acidoferrales bacterium]|nr:hypothetical protein [Candidatus Acidoferrales bacterium]
MRPFIARLGELSLVAAVLAACSANGGSLPSATSGSAASLAVPAASAAAPSRVVSVSSDDVAAAYHVTDFAYRVFPTIPRRVGKPDVKIVYPAQLHYYGGPYMKTALWHNIYVNCRQGTDGCWGDPQSFQKALTNSQLVKLLTQYTKAKAGAYVFSDGTQVQWPTYSKYVYDNDLFSILHAVAKQNGGNFQTAEYHIFLPRGVDTCFDGTSECYSPDVRSTFYFCAYHGYVKFSDIGAVTFSVEPYQNVNGCVYPNLPKGYDPLVNSTDTTLAHETFESITDTNPSTYKTLAWYNLAYNQEVADLCDDFPMVQKFGKLKLFIQEMYSNKYHACANGS